MSTDQLLAAEVARRARHALNDRRWVDNLGKRAQEAIPRRSI